MSGGHYDYIQYRLDDIASKMRHDAKFHEDIPGDIANRMSVLANKIDAVALSIKDIDLYMSHDNGDDSTRELISKWPEWMRF